MCTLVSCWGWLCLLLLSSQVQNTVMPFPPEEERWAHHERVQDFDRFEPDPRAPSPPRNVLSNASVVGYQQYVEQHIDRWLALTQHTHSPSGREGTVRAGWSHRSSSLFDREGLSDCSVGLCARGLSGHSMGLYDQEGCQIVVWDCMTKRVVWP